MHLSYAVGVSIVLYSEMTNIFLQLLHTYNGPTLYRKIVTKIFIPTEIILYTPIRTYIFDDK